MPKLIRCCAAAALTLIFAGCGDSDKAADAEALLKYIPADTPYVVATLEPMPDDAWAAIEPKFDSMLKAYAELFRAISEQIADNSSFSADLDEKEKPKVAAVLNKLEGVMSIDGLEEIGLRLNSTSAMYGHGLLPVMRLSIADSEKLNGFFDSLEQAMGESMSTATIGDQSYRYFGETTIRVLVATQDQQLVVSVVPVEASEETLRAVLGLTLPEVNLGDTTELDDLAKTYGYLKTSIGYIDTLKIVNTFVDPQTGPNAELLGIMDYDSGDLPEECRTEIKEMAGVMPRLTVGYTALDEDKMDMKMVFELRDDLAAGLSKVAAPVPGMGGDLGGVFGFGMSFDLSAIRDFAMAQIAAIEADPYECVFFAELQENAAASRQALSQPLPPFAESVKGFAFVLESFDGIDFNSPTPPTSFDLRGIVAVDNAPALLAMGQMFSPDLATLDIQADSKAVELPSGSVPGMNQAAYVAMADDAIAFAIGKGLDAQLPGMLTAASPTPPPLMSVSYDMDAYMKFVGAAMERDLAGKADDAEAVVEAAMKLMNEISTLMDRAAMDIVVSGRGIEIDYAAFMN